MDYFPTGKGTDHNRIGFIGAVIISLPPVDSTWIWIGYLLLWVLVWGWAVPTTINVLHESRPS